MSAPSLQLQVKYKVGDVSATYPFLQSSIYDWLLEKHNDNVTKAAIEALEMIINQIALSPESLETDAVRELRPSVPVLEKRLLALKKELTENALGRSRFPMLIHSDRKNWDDFDELFPKN